MVSKVKSNFQNHPYHLVSPSPWPLYTSAALFTVTTTGVLSMHGFSFISYVLFIALFNLIASMTLWFRDVISEGTYLGNHTNAVQKGLNLGVGLFIVSEALFFLAIFWTFFHSSLAPNIELGGEWPPMGIHGINPFELPLLNTIILLSSGFTVTFAHHSVIQGNRRGALYGLVITIILAVFFYSFTRYRIYSFIFYYLRWNIRFLFLFWYGFSWVTCNNWYYFLSSRFLTFACLPFYWPSSPRTGVRYIILTFCRCCLAFFIYFYIFLRLLVS